MQDAPLSSFPSHRPTSVFSPRRQCHPKRRFLCRRIMWASRISAAPRRGWPAPRSDGDPLYTPAARDPSPGIGPAGSRRRGLAPLLGRSSQSRSGTYPLRRENTPGREKDLSGQGALRGVQPRSRAWHLPGAAAYGAAPGPRPQGPRDGVRGEGAQRFPPGVRTFNFKLLFIYFYLKGIQ